MREGSGLFVTPARSASPGLYAPLVRDDARFFIVKSKYPLIRQSMEQGLVTMKPEFSHGLRDVLSAYTPGFLIYINNEGLQMSGYVGRPYDTFHTPHYNSRSPLLAWPQIQARLGAERNGGQVCEFRVEWIRGAAVPYKEYRHLAISGSSSIQHCKSGQEIPFDTGSALLRIIHDISYGDGGPGSLAAGGQAIKAER